MWATLRKHAGDRRRASSQLFHARFDPRLDAADERADARGRDRGRDRGGARRRSRASTRTASCAASSTPCRRRCAPTSIQLDADGAAASRRSPSSSTSRKLDDLPLPRPLCEIFVYSPRVEGVHLRFGKVARGGIRWSDRPQDFRTEVLGLVKAQQVKNAVIVPVGAKGGFVPKQLPAGARATRSRPRAPPPTSCSSRACSTSPTISTATASSRRDDVVRHDGDDPYLVVAADKGTATFSDIANGISRRARLLARRRLRVRRLGRLRPQEDGHHRARRLGGGEAAFPRDGHRHHDDAVHRRRRRRHVGRRVRQRHAARAHHQARRRLRPSRHLHRSRSRSGRRASPSASGCSSCRARAGRTTTRR